MQGYHQILIDTERAEAEKLLASAGLSLPAGCEYGLGYYEDGVLAACGFLAGNVLCGFCVAPAARGSGVSTAILSRLVLHGKERGINHFFVFTKAQEADKFASAGFALIAQSRDAALLEQGRPDYGDWFAATRERVRDFAPQAGSPASGQDCGQNCGQDCGQANASQGSDPHQKPGVLPALGAIVMNANPFTRGHEYLARTAAASCERLLVFVVEEDISVVPFAVRFALVREGLANLPNILVLPAGPYMVSRASFPAYFTADEARSAVHAGLDCAIFASRIAPDLGITIRFVGTEPYDPVTREYNAVMAREFAQYGLALQEIPRLESACAAVSASRVRALLRGDAGAAQWAELESLLPPATYTYLRSAEGAELRQRLRSHTGRH